MASNPTHIERQCKGMCIATIYSSLFAKESHCVSIVFMNRFDPHFNAITGLNGSGKSNILDAICFVLGITNLSQVRAGNLSELVYKQGQAGVNKATVTIVFNNEDTVNSPVGFEQCSEVTVTRQVLLGGKSKYLINGRNAPANAVQNLFHSVQLNVNNPHFLIMQGRITKVLNMKSHEILGMVEEAAGTRMYETKRVAALKTIEKKQAKVDEINSILEEEITPTLERLRGEKQNYLKWSKNSADVERIERFCIAHQFHVAQAALEQNVEGVAAMEEQIMQLDKEAEQIQEQIFERDREIALQSSMLKGEMGDQLTLTKKLEQERSNDLVRITSIWKNQQESLAKAEADLDSAKNVVEETQAAIVFKEKEILDDSYAASVTVEAALTAEQELERLTLEYQRMSAGMSTSTEDRTLPEQISQAHADSKIAESKIAQAQMKLSHLAKELKV
jgi:structural maintenance of chromosome 2